MTPVTKQVEGCVSCGVRLVDQGSAAFPCPSCGTMTGRCPRCRDQGVLYKCPSCEFRGP